MSDAPHSAPQAGSDGTAPAPRANPDLVGHDKIERELRRLHEARRLPHAILLAGPRGIGKATLAFRLARFVLAPPEDRDDAGGGLGVDPRSGVFRRVAAGGHADLLTVERAWDSRRRRLRGEIVVEDARAIGQFFHLTAAEEGWRVVIIDGADAMNRNAANAVLKILEEPPRHGLLVLVGHNLGRLLATIRSRCRSFRLEPLQSPQTLQLLGRYRPGLAEDEAAALAALAAGSIGRALELAEAGGLELYRSLLDLMSPAPELAIGRLYGFVDRLVRAEAEAGYNVVAELISQFVARLAADLAHGRCGVAPVVAAEEQAMRRLGTRADAARWAALRERIDESFVRTEFLNLDRKQAMLGAFFAIAELAR